MYKTLELGKNCFGHEHNVNAHFEPIGSLHRPPAEGWELHLRPHTVLPLIEVELHEK